MPVKKTAAKKVAAKKAPAKSAAPALAKKVASAKKPAKTAASASKGPAKTVDELVSGIVAAIEGGQFDGFIQRLDEAVTNRLVEHEKDRVAKETKEKVAAEGKKVGAAPKRGETKPAAKKSPPKAIALKKGETYKLIPKKFNSAKVKFLRFKKDDKDKAVIEFVDSRPGYPKGKQIMILASALKSAS